MLPIAPISQFTSNIMRHYAPFAGAIKTPRAIRKCNLLSRPTNPESFDAWKSWHWRQVTPAFSMPWDPSSSVFTSPFNTQSGGLRSPNRRPQDATGPSKGMVSWPEFGPEICFRHGRDLVVAPRTTASRLRCLRVWCPGQQSRLRATVHPALDPQGNRANQRRQHPAPPD